MLELHDRSTVSWLERSPGRISKLLKSGGEFDLVPGAEFRRGLFCDIVRMQHLINDGEKVLELDGCLWYLRQFDAAAIPQPTSLCRIELVMAIGLENSLEHSFQVRSRALFVQENASFRL